MTSLIDKFRDYLTSCGNRFTRQKELLVQVVLSLSSPFDVEMVVEAASRASPPVHVSRATVHLTLSQLRECDLIEVVTDPVWNVAHDQQCTSQLYRSISEHCGSTHSKMIAGKCPWCGRAVLYNN